MDTYHLTLKSRFRLRSYDTLNKFVTDAEEKTQQKWENSVLANVVLVQWTHGLTAAEEHVSDDCMFLVDLERMSTEHNPLHNDTVRVNRQQPTRTNQLL